MGGVFWGCGLIIGGVIVLLRYLPIADITTHFPNAIHIAIDLPAMPGAGNGDCNSEAGEGEYVHLHVLRCGVRWVVLGLSGLFSHGWGGPVGPGPRGWQRIVHQVSYERV